MQLFKLNNSHRRVTSISITSKRSIACSQTKPTRCLQYSPAFNDLSHRLKNCKSFHTTILQRLGINDRENSSRLSVVEKVNGKEEQSSNESDGFEIFRMVSRVFGGLLGSLLGFHFFKSKKIVKAAYPFQHNFVADIVSKAGPAVVFIEIKGKHPVSGKRVTLTNGSGFLVRSNGLILTNAHVVADKSKVSVKLHNGRVYEGTVVAVDPVCDLATVKIDADKALPIISLGKASSIRPGEFVAAMGSPLSLHKTVTVGIVSSKLRASKELGMQKDNMEYIQTDATIGLGNSGGPLVNLAGQAIGINTLKLAEGISFAIPADYANKLLEKADQLMAKAGANRKPNYMPNGKESSQRRYMGITMLPLTPLLIMELKGKIKGFPEITAGVYVHKVVVNSPAYAGGLHAGDIIVEINKTPIKTATDVYNMVEKEQILSVTVIRGNRQDTFTVETENM